MDAIARNRTFDELRPGDSATLERIAGGGIDLMAAVSDEAAAAPAAEASGPSAAQGLWATALVLAAVATRLPGPGTVVLAEDLAFLKPPAAGDRVTATVTVREKRAEGRTVLLDAVCTGGGGERLLTGTVTVAAPDRRIEWREGAPPAAAAAQAVGRAGGHAGFIGKARALPPVSAAIVHPCSPEALEAAIEVMEAGLLSPLLVGPEAKIRRAAASAGISLEGIPVEDVEHSHAAAARAVELAAAGRVSVLVKGSLHTEELLGAVVARGSGLRTGRRISHVYAMDVPAYDKPVVVTDAAINIQPTLEEKRDICQNAIDFLHLLGIGTPLVAVLAAVETVNAKMPATLDAAALTVMAMRGQITGARVDGPLAFDNAISPLAARIKGIVSEVAGHADILLVPDLEAGNMLAKQLIYFAGATAAGLVLGARVPIVLTSRADPLSARIASAAMARLAAEARAPVPAAEG